MSHNSSNAGGAYQRSTFAVPTKIPIPSFVPFPPASAVSPPGGNIKREGDDEKGREENGTTTHEEGVGRRNASSLSCNRNALFQSSLTGATMIRLPLNEQWMTKLESALQLHQRQQIQKTSVSYSDFCKCASRLVLDADKETTTKSGGDSDDTTRNASKVVPPVISDLPDDSPILELSQEERLWHDLYCVAVPTLYTCSDDDDGNSNHGVDHRRKPGDLALALLPPGGNRWKELRRLVQKAQSQGVPADKSERAVTILHSLRRQNKTAKRTNETKTTCDADITRKVSGKWTEEEPSAIKKTTAILDSLFGVSTASTSLKQAPSTTTLEDRIRARALERERNLQQAQATKKDPREDRVAVADTLYSHANRILRRSRPSRLGGDGAGSGVARATSSIDAGAATSPGTKCVLTFGDVRQVLQQWPRKEIASLLQDIVKIVPGWIRWIDSARGENCLPISKDATVWIETADYKRVRAILNGEKPLVAQPANDKHISTHSTSSLSSPASISSELTPAAPIMMPPSTIPIVTSCTKKVPPASTVRREEVLSFSNNGNKRPASAQDEFVASRPAKSRKFVNQDVQRVSRIVPESRNQGVHTSIFSQSSPMTGSKRMSSDTRHGQDDDLSIRPDKTAKTTMSQRQRQNLTLQDSSSDSDYQREAEVTPTTKRPLLRINENLILCDADYDGGTVFQPSLEFPRGLRRLFLALNAGERI